MVASTTSSIRNIFNPRTRREDLCSHIRYAFGTLMPQLLLASAAKFTAPHTRFVVLGYYPVVTVRQSARKSDADAGGVGNSAQFAGRLDAVAYRGGERAGL